MITLSELLEGVGYDIDYVKGVLKRGFEDALGVEAWRGVLTGAEIELAQRLSERHGTRDSVWTIRSGWLGSGRNEWIVDGMYHVL